MGKTRDPSKHPSFRRDGSGGAETVSLEELAREQQVSPVTDLDALGELLPAEDDPDAMLAFVQSEREARRRAADE